MTLIILDPNLAHAHGHHMEWDLTIADTARNREQGVVIFAHRECPMPSRDGLEIVPWFSHSCYEERSRDQITGKFDDFRYFNDTLAEELAAIPRNRFKASDVVLVPTLTEKHLLGYVAWMKSFNRAHAALFVVYLMFPSGLGASSDSGQMSVADPFQALFYKLAFQRATDPGPKIHFFGGGRQLAREFSELLGETIEPHPIPNCPERRKPMPGTRARSAALLFAGDAKIDKGFLLIPPLAQKLCDAYPEWDFLVHANAGAAWGDALVAYNELLDFAMTRSNVRVLTGRLTREEYVDLLEDADCYVSVYDPVAYARKSSGVIWESISLGIPVLAAKDTWLDGEVKEWGAGYEVYTDWSVEGIFAKFQDLVRELPAKYALSASAAERYRAFNGPEEMINQIGRLWMPRLMAASLTAQPTSRSQPLEKVTGAGWSYVEGADGKTVRWVAKDFDIDFDWPFTSPWRVDIGAAHCVASEQIIQATASVGGKAASVSVEAYERGGRISVTGAGLGRDRPYVRLRVSLPWAFRPNGETRDLGILVESIQIGPAEADGGTDGEAQSAFDVLTPVVRSEDGRSFRLTEVISGAALLDPHNASEIAFEIRTTNPAAAHAVQLYVNGCPVALTVVALGDSCWQAVAACDPSFLSRGGYRTEWDLLLAPEARGTEVWIGELSANGRAGLMSFGGNMVDAPSAEQPDEVTAPDTPEEPGGAISLATFSDARLVEHFVGTPAYAHIDLSFTGITFRDETWSRVRFKFCSARGEHYIEFRDLPGWPQVIEFGAEPVVDQYGPLLQIGDEKQMPPGASHREHLLIEAIAQTLPGVTEMAIRKSGSNSAELSDWIERARISSERWTRKLAQAY